MRFKLADASTGTVSAVVPAKPVGTTPTTIPGVTLGVYLAKRLNTNAVLAVFAVQIPAALAGSATLESSLAQGMDANYGRTSNVLAVSGVSLFDPAALKEYLPFMANPSDDATCLCSNLASASFIHAGTVYLAALVAAPPAGVSSASFVTGVGTIPNVPLT